MTNVTTAPLPHRVGTADIANPELKRVAMLLMENIVALKKQLEAAQAAIKEIQRGGQ